MGASRDHFIISSRTLLITDSTCYLALIQPYIACDPDKIVAIIESTNPDNTTENAAEVISKHFQQVHNNYLH